MKKLLILGYGNPDREDDGVAYWILKQLMLQYQSSEGLEIFQESGFTALNEKVDLWFNLQLIPEISSDLIKYDNAIFLDAHTAEIQDELLIKKIIPKYQNSPFTHHLTPSTCLALADKVYGHAPDAKLITIRGYSFEFSNDLSERTQDLAKKALRKIKDLINAL